MEPSSWFSCLPFWKPSKNNIHILLPLMHFKAIHHDDNDDDGDSPMKLEEYQTLVSTVDLNLSLWFSSSSDKAAEKMMRRSYITEEIAEEEFLGVSMELRLYDYRFPWKMTKKLTGSDVGSSCRLILESNWAKKYVLPRLDAERMESTQSVLVRVFDCDTRTEHELAFTMWSSCRSYTLKK